MPVLLFFRPLRCGLSPAPRLLAHLARTVTASAALIFAATLVAGADAVPAAARPEPAAATHVRELRLDARYLNFPVRTGAPKARASLAVADRPVREFDLELDAEQPDFWVFLDVAAWRGQPATLRVTGGNEPAKTAAAVTVSDTLHGAEDLYVEPQRPQFHFSSRRGWLNDPNGLVHYAGEYHLFYQLHPYGWNAGSKHWGQAISRDLVHWEERPIALYADETGQMYSGSAVVDWHNTSGFQQGKEQPIVLIYTATGPPRVQALAYSNDRGRTWTHYAGNPVLREVRPLNRDPKVIWHEPTRRWIMVLYAGYPQAGQKDAKGKQVVKNMIDFFSSPDLKTWQPICQVEGFYECPDLFELPMAGSPGQTRWVLHGGLCDYMVGTFDGKTFQPETPILDGPRGSAFFAAQTFSDMPDGRRVQIGWARMTQAKARAIFGGAPFNQMMNFPCELSLRATAEGPRLAWQPVRELAALRRQHHPFPAGPLAPEQNPLRNLATETFELTVELEPGDATHLELNLRGVTLSYDVKRRSLLHEDGPTLIALRDGRLRLRALVDRGLAEVFLDDGLIYLPLPRRPLPEGKAPLALTARGGTAKIITLDVHELASIWPAAQEVKP